MSSPHEAVARLRRVLDVGATGVGPNGYTYIAVRKDDLATLLNEFPCQTCAITDGHQKAWREVDRLRAMVDRLIERVAALEGRDVGQGRGADNPKVADETAAPLPSPACDNCWSAMDCG